MSESDLQNALRISEARYRRLFETAQDGILLLNAETAKIEDVNPFLIELLGYSHEEFLGKKIWEVGVFKDADLSKDAFAELQAKHYIRYDDLPLATSYGSSVSVEFVGNLYDCEGINVIQCNIRDNTKRHVKEIALRVATRSFQMLSESNFALISLALESTLLAEFCRIAVETGGYRMAWVGFAENGPDKNVKIVASYADSGNYLAQSEITWAESERGNGPACRALRTEQIQVSENISTDPTMKTWQAKAAKNGFSSCIVLPFRLPDEIMACLTIYGATCDVWSTPERKLLQEIASDLSFGIKTLRTAITMAQQQERLSVSLEQTIQVLADTIEERDAYTAGHQKSVADISSAIAAELGLSAERSRGLHLAASIHDLGKIGVPAEILSKTRRLNAMEFGLIKEHPSIGYEILKNVSFPWPIAQIILQHHERIDGSGYPLGLKGDAMLLESKILAVADVVEAMASHRPYRAALGIETALNEIKIQRGVTFDAEVVDACLRIFNEKGYVIEL